MHDIFLKKAYELATLRKGFCSPNPSVGAVIVKRGQILSTGTHFKAGEPHAEIVALNQTQESVDGATLYVTLEPCCHFGKTPPCTHRIIQSGIKEVVYGYVDPNPIVSQKGHQILLDSNISCLHYPIAEINQFYQSYSHFHETGLPFVTAKIAISQDHKIAKHLITGKNAEKMTHLFRKNADAILTTAKTIQADNPQFNARIDEKIIKKHLFVMGSDEKVSKNSKIYSSALSVTFFNGKTVQEIMQEIGKKGVHDLWVEAGGTFFAELIKSGFIHRAFVYMAPVDLGDSFSTFEFPSSMKKISSSILDPDILYKLEF